MGSSLSQEQQQLYHQQQPSKSLCLLQLIRRSWRIVAASANRVKGPHDADDCATDLSSASRCSGCKGCGYHQELNFDSESDMAPNAEEDLLVTMPCGPHSPKERLRPPTYNAEDYAIALRRWGKRALSGQTDNNNGNGNNNSSSSNHNNNNNYSSSSNGNNNHSGTLPSTCTSSSSGYASGNAGEMTLRQFTSVSELLNKLKADLRLAFPSFVQEFASAPAEGISLLLETLRGVQLSQSTPPTAGPRRPRARRAALDELGCVECLTACLERCPEAARSLAQAQPGLLALAVCLTSSLNRSRVLALQLLTRVCQTTGGHAAVSEAVSTMRLRYGEGGRFRFLAGALLAPKAALALRVAGLSFLNAFLASAPRAQTKLYIQAEACEAGLEPRVLQEWLKYVDEEEEPATELLREEVRKWTRHCVDVDALQGRARRAEETCRVLSKKVSALQRQLQKIQLERLNEYNSGGRGQEKPAEQQIPSGAAKERRREEGQSNPKADKDKKVSSSAEDEGISFSERSSSPEEQRTSRPATNNLENDQETTIDDVIEELRIIVKDAEEELHDWNQLQQDERSPQLPKPELLKSDVLVSKARMRSPNIKAKPPPVCPSKARECLRNTEESARIDRGLEPNPSLKIIVPGALQNRNVNSNEEEDKESVIVPAIIHPQPPRRAPPCIVDDSLFVQQGVLDHHHHHRRQILDECLDSEHDDDLLLLEDDGSDSLLSASRLNYSQVRNNNPKVPYERQVRESPTGSGDLKLVENLADFETSETVLDERVAKKRPEPASGNPTGPKTHPKCANAVQRRTERRKYLRRCQSQDHIEAHRDSRQSPGKSRNPGVIDYIRKFESLNSFDERCSLEDARLRRSESFHQARLSCSGGSDSGLAYSSVPEPPVPAQATTTTTTTTALAQPRRGSATKSLDRIDEGLMGATGAALLAAKERRAPLGGRPSAACRAELVNGGPSGQRQQRRRERFPEDDRKYTSFLDTRRERAEYLDRSASGSRGQSDSRIFAGRPHDVLGFGKNRFNAGKYSGNGHGQQQQQHQQQQFATRSAERRGSGSHQQQQQQQHHGRGKVTDMVSGLY